MTICKVISTVLKIRIRSLRGQNCSRYHPAHLLVSTTYLTKQLSSLSDTIAGFTVDSLFAWHTGMTLCDAPDELLVTDVQDVVNSVKATHLHLTPTFASHLNPACLPSVQYVITRGEYPMVKVHRDWAGKGLYQGTCSFSDVTAFLHGKRLRLST